MARPFPQLLPTLHVKHNANQFSHARSSREGCLIVAAFQTHLPPVSQPVGSPRAECWWRPSGIRSSPLVCADSIEDHFLKRLVIVCHLTVSGLVEPKSRQISCMQGATMTEACPAQSQKKHYHTRIFHLQSFSPVFATQSDHDLRISES